MKNANAKSIEFFVASQVRRPKISHMVVQYWSNFFKGLLWYLLFFKPGDSSNVLGSSRGLQMEARESTARRTEIKDSQI